MPPCTAKRSKATYFRKSFKILMDDSRQDVQPLQLYFSTLSPSKSQSPPRRARNELLALLPPSTPRVMSFVRQLPNAYIVDGICN